MRRVLRPQELDMFVRSRSPSLTALNALGSLIVHSDMRIEAKIHFDESLRELQGSFQCCEKIITTPWWVKQLDDGVSK